VTVFQVGRLGVAQQCWVTSFLTCVVVTSGGDSNMLSFTMVSQGW